jgi:hypothetical protein
MAIPGVGFCPHCGNDAPQTNRAGAVDEHRTAGARSYMLAQCTSCGGVLLYFYKPTEVLDLTPDKLLWPPPGDIHPAVPERVRKRYLEAKAIKGRSPAAFANQIRRALEAVCHNRQATKGMLADKLKELASKREIPDKLAEMTFVLKDMGNIGSHDGDDDIDAADADVIDDFFRAVVEYVYIAPFKVEEVKKRLADAKTTAGASPST